MTEEIKTDNVEIPKTEETPKTEEKKPITFTLEEVAKIRQDEKNKLYPEISRIKDELVKFQAKSEDATTEITNLSEVVKAKDAEIAELKAKIEAYEKEGESSMDKDKQLEEVFTKISQLETALKVKDEEFNSYKMKVEIDAYKASKLKDVDESVRDLVEGNSQEEINASIEKAKAVYDRVSKKLGSPNISAPGVPPVALGNMNELFKNVKADDIMKMSSKEYAEWRKANGLK